jgi:WD40 repeat protein
MPATKPSKLKPVQLRQAFITDLVSCWQYARSLHPKETPYAYVLFGLEGSPQLYPHVLTEQGLQQAAKRYVANGHYEKVEEARKELRYSIEDSPHATELEGKLPTVDAMVEPVAHTLNETQGYALLAKAAMEAFAVLDKQGTFGSGKQRDGLLLMIDTSFAEKDWSLPSVSRLNPSTAVKRYEMQTKVEGVYASCDALTFSPDGKSLFFAGRREIDPRKEKSVYEVVGCEVVGLQLKRRWNRSFPGLNGFRAIATSGDGASVCAIANQFRGGEKTALFKFDCRNGKQIQTHMLRGAAQSLAFTPDSQHITVATAEALYLLDQDFRELQTVKLKSYPFDVLPLKTGEILVGCEKGLMRVDMHFKAAIMRSKEIFRLSADKSNRIALISRGYVILGSDRERNSEFGFQVYALPKLKLLKTITIPERQVARATISPNGNTIACEANGIGKRTTDIVVFETKHFREVARRKSNSVSDLKFSPDGQLLAFTKTGHTTSEPIVLWRIPRK